MIIVSQDKAIIINFDSLDYVCKNDDVPVLYAKMNDGSEIQIGEYATEERAKEVLEEIAEREQDKKRIKELEEEIENKENKIWQLKETVQDLENECISLHELIDEEM